MLREAADGILQNDNVISAAVFSADGKLLIDRTRKRAGDNSAETGRLLCHSSLTFSLPSWKGK